MRIAHIDLDSFFVSAERLKRPELRGVPMAVGGTGPRGVISSASYEARRLGVKSAMPTQQAFKLCPQLIMVPPQFSLYSELSEQVMAMLNQYSPQVEVVSIDEAYLDLTGTETLNGSASEQAQRIRQAVLNQLGLTLSVGIASSRPIAKIATDACKPDGLLEIPVGQETEFLKPLPVNKIPGVGPVTEERLREVGVYTIRDLIHTPLNLIESRVGDHARYLLDIARGGGNTQFNQPAERPSVSRETTFPKNESNEQVLLTQLRELVSDLCESLRANDQDLDTIELKFRTPDFKTWTRSKKLRSPLRSEAALFGEIQALFVLNWPKHEPLRLIGVGGQLHREDDPTQLDLFVRQRDLAADQALDEIRARFGPNLIRKG